MKQLLLFSTLIASTAFSQTTNCAGATQVCNDVSFVGNSGGAGNVELTAANQGCLGVEHQSSWYYFQPVTSGTVALTIQTTVDYDFAIWATGNCANLGAPVRCSYSSAFGNTGLMVPFNGQTSSLGCGFLGLGPCSGLITTVNNAVDNTEGAGGDAWVNALPVVAGQTYIMLIDNFTANSTPFTLDWTFTGGASLNCAPIPLPIELSEFIAAYDAGADANVLSWKTASERDSDYFTVERSIDGMAWMVIDKATGAGNSDAESVYLFTDTDFEPGNINYYRLNQTDFDGNHKMLGVVSVSNLARERTVIRTCNAMGQEATTGATGVLILIYDDGTTQRIFR